MNNESDSKNIIMMKYLEGRLDFKEKNIFEKELLKSSDQLNLLLELKKDIFLMENIEFKEVPDALLKRVVKNKTEKNLGLENELGEIILKFIDRSFELIKDTFSTNLPERELFSYRDNEKSFEKIIFTKNDIEISIIPIPGNKLNLNINTKKNIEDNILLYKKIDDNLRLVASIKPINNKINFHDVDPANYIIKLNNKNLFLKIES